MVLKLVFLWFISTLLIVLIIRKKPVGEIVSVSLGYSAGYAVFWFLIINSNKFI